MEENEFELALRELRTEYVRMLPAHIDEIERAWSAAHEAGWDAAQFGSMIRLAHNLAGSGATYGVKRVSETARALELYAKSLDGNAMPGEAERHGLERLLAQVRACAEEKAPPEGGDTSFG